jgi:methylisocitrate lyase
VNGSAGPAALSALLGSGKLVVAPGAFDAYSARIIESLGFPAIYLGGNALGLQLAVGQPFVTLTDTADAVNRIRRATRAPVVVDAGAGFGDAAHAALAARTLVHAGAAAIHVDDQVYPKRAHYHRGRARLADVDSVCGKLQSVVGACEKGELLVIARTDALRITRSVDQTLERCRRYAGCGIDMLMVLDLGVEQALKFREAFPALPLVWIGGIAEPVPTTAQLQAAGFAMAVYPFTSTGAMTESLLATWRGVLDTGRPPLAPTPVSQTVETALRLIGLERYLDIERSTTERPD